MHNLPGPIVVMGPLHWNMPGLCGMLRNTKTLITILCGLSTTVLPPNE